MPVINHFEHDSSTQSATILSKNQQECTTLIPSTTMSVMRHVPLIQHKQTLIIVVCFLLLFVLLTDSLTWSYSSHAINFIPPILKNSIKTTPLPNISVTELSNKRQHSSFLPPLLIFLHNRTIFQNKTIIIPKMRS